MKEEALKLADELDKYKGIVTRDAAKMLRQQSDRIAELEKINDFLNEGWSKDQDRIAELEKEVQNLKAGLLSHNDIYHEPTAWINHIKQTGGDFYELNVSGRGEPLYRHPPQTKPLSDEEIWELHQEHIDEIPCGHSMKTIGFVEFARAIEKRHGIK
jgi:hypothetical protein